MHNIETFDSELIKNILENEDKYITNLFNILPIPVSALQRGFDEDELVTVSKNKIPKVENSTSTRAKTLEELHNKLNEIKSKKNLSYKEKLTKKGLKNRIKKKEKKLQKNLKKKELRNKKSKDQVTIKSENTDDVEEEQKPKQDKPIFNSQGKMVFSKFDFSQIGKKKKLVKDKTKKDPRKILQDIEEQNKKLKELKESGEKEKAEQLKQKHIWKSALAKAEGQKVKDDPILLKKSIKKREEKIKQSKKKWKARKEGVEKAKEERQKKRLENINKRKKEKKLNKLKKAAKKGKIIPGL